MLYQNCSISTLGGFETLSTSVSELPTEVKPDSNELDSTHKVFAHYMLGQPTYYRQTATQNITTKNGYNDLTINYQWEIQDAISSGIDGFAVYIPIWDQFVHAKIEKMFQAIDLINTNEDMHFCLFFAPAGFAFNTPEKRQTLVDAMREFGTHKNYCKIDNRPILNPWQGSSLGSQAWKKDVITPLLIGNHNLSIAPISIYFVPWFFKVSDKYSSEKSTQKTFNEFLEITDANYWWGAGKALYPDIKRNPNSPALNWPENYIENRDAYYAESEHLNIPMVDAIVPSFWQTCKGYDHLNKNYFGSYKGAWNQKIPIYREHRGTEGIALQWNHILKKQPQFIIVATWNDFAEGSYLTPASKNNNSDNSYEAEPLPFGPIMNYKMRNYSHRGMAKFNALYSEIYKQKKHSLADYKNDYVFVTHRLQFARNADVFPLNSTQSLNNESEQCPGVQMEMNNAEDKIFFSTIFKESAIIKIKIKSTEITQNICPS